MSVKNPYSVLGVDPSATDEEIKKAYHDLVRKYHPDRYKDSDLASVANEKMTEINAAYDEIQKMRAEGVRSGTTDFGYGGGAAGQRSGADALHAEAYDAVRKYINSGDVTSAQAVLAAIPEEDRGAEWNFLYGCVLVRLGRYMEAGSRFDSACRADPYNREYANARDQLRMHTYNSAGQSEYSGGRVYDCNPGCGDGCLTSLCRACCILRCCCGI